MKCVASYIMSNQKHKYTATIYPMLLYEIGTAGSHTCNIFIVYLVPWLFVRTENTMLLMICTCCASIDHSRALWASVAPLPGTGSANQADHATPGCRPLNQRIRSGTTQHWSGNCLSLSIESTSMEACRNCSIHCRTSHTMMMMMVMVYLLEIEKSAIEKKDTRKHQAKLQREMSVRY